MKTIFTITLNPTVDKSSKVNHIQPDKKLRCEQPKYQPGGGGINVSRGLNVLGIESTAFFPSGGRTGELLKSLLEKESITINTMEVEAETRENFIVVDTSNNKQYRFGMPGEEIQNDEVKNILSQITNLSPFPDFIVISGSLPPGIDPSYLRNLIKEIKNKGAKVIADTSGDALNEALEEGVFMLKPNLGELSRLSGMEALDNESAEEAAQKLIDEGRAEIIVVSMGPQGAYLVTKKENLYVPAPSIKKLTTVGAGDSMVAGMISVLAKEGSYKEMVKMGVACGTAATMNSGSGLFKKEDVERLYRWLCK